MSRHFLEGKRNELLRGQQDTLHLPDYEPMKMAFIC